MTSGLRVLHLIDSGGLYGAESVILNLSLRLKKHRHWSSIGCLAYKGTPLPVIGIEAARLGLDAHFFILRNKFDVSCLRAIASYCKTNAVSIIHSHGYKPSLLCFLLKLLYNIPYIITCHLSYVSNLRMRLYTCIEKISMLTAQSVVCVSEEILNYLHGSRLCPDRLRMISNGIDAEPYSSYVCPDVNNLRRHLGLKASSLVIGSLGRLTEQKDYKTLVCAAAEVFRQTADAEVIVAGEGHLRSRLVTQVKLLEIQDRFHFLGFRNDKMDVLKLMDIFVLCSLDEGLPMSMLEAMAAGIPIVVTNVGGIRNVVKDGENGLLIEAGNPAELAHAILSLLSNGQERARLAANAFNTVSRDYSLDRMTNQYLDVYTGAIGLDLSRTIP